MADLQNAWKYGKIAWDSKARGNIEGYRKTTIFPNGESLKAVEKRVNEFINYIKQEHVGKTIGKYDYIFKNI